jgi:hypothetical protein
VLLLTVLSLMSCADPGGDQAVDECDGSGDKLTWVIWELMLTRPQDGISQGFDLDGRVSGDWDDDACNIPDYTRPDGTEGIDNAMALALPALEATEAGALEPLLNSQINEGSILLMLELSDLDDLVNDDCVTLDVGQATGMPLVGSDDRLLAGQTLDWDPEAPRFSLPDLVLRDGVLEAGPFELDIPFSVFNQEQRLVLHDAQILIALADDGTAGGTFGGGVEVEKLLEFTQQSNVDTEVFETLVSLIDLISDMAIDDSGTCQQISLNLDYQAVSAWTYE